MPGFVKEHLRPLAGSAGLHLVLIVLLAGAAGITPLRFTIAIALGRGIRYFGEGALAVWYGDAALQFLENNGRTVSLSLALLMEAGLGGYLLYQKTRRTA